MSERENVNKRSALWRRLVFSPTLAGKNKSHTIAYIAIFVAINVAVNAIGSVPLGFIQISLTIFVSVLTGIIIGPIFGFVSCFLGDTLGFFMGASGYAWTPWVGLSTAMAALIGGLVMNGIRWRFRGAWCVKLAFACTLTFLVWTWAINTTAGYFLWNSGGWSYWTFVGIRLGGQVWVSLLNYVFLFIAVPALGKIKPLKVDIR